MGVLWCINETYDKTHQVCILSLKNTLLIMYIVPIFVYYDYILCNYVHNIYFFTDCNHKRWIFVYIKHIYEFLYIIYGSDIGILEYI